MTESHQPLSVKTTVNFLLVQPGVKSGFILIYLDAISPISNKKHHQHGKR